MSLSGCLCTKRRSSRMTRKLGTNESVNDEGAQPRTGRALTNDVGQRIPRGPLACDMRWGQRATRNSNGRALRRPGVSVPITVPVADYSKIPARQVVDLIGRSGRI